MGMCITPSERKLDEGSLYKIQSEVLFQRRQSVRHQNDARLLFLEYRRLESKLEELTTLCVDEILRLSIKQNVVLIEGHLTYFDPNSSSKMRSILEEIEGIASAIAENYEDNGVLVTAHVQQKIDVP